MIKFASCLLHFSQDDLDQTTNNFTHNGSSILINEMATSILDQNSNAKGTSILFLSVACMPDASIQPRPVTLKTHASCGVYPLHVFTLMVYSFQNLLLNLISFSVIFM